MMAFVPFVETDQPTMAAFNEKFQQNYEAAVDAGLQVSTGTYVGTGAYGAANPNKLSFNFRVEFLCVLGVYNNGGPYLYGGFGWLAESASGKVKDDTVAHLIWSEKDVSWYQDVNANYQLNEAGGIYAYFAAGRKEE